LFVGLSAENRGTICRNFLTRMVLASRVLGRGKWSEEIWRGSSSSDHTFEAKYPFDFRGLGS
jgi:hypothetical protein